MSISVIVIKFRHHHQQTNSKLGSNYILNKYLIEKVISQHYNSNKTRLLRNVTFHKE